MGYSSTANILLVEDDEAARNIASILIRQIEGAVVFETEGGERALEVMETTPIDVVVTDLMMPRMDGFEFIKKIRENPENKDIHIIIMTALYEVGDKVRGLELGANDYITKPFDHQELIARVMVGIRTVNLHRQLKETNRKLEEALSFKQLLMGRVAHDLRTPLTIINGYLDMVRNSYEDLSRKDFERYFNRISQQTRFINAMCEDILSYTAVEMGQLSINLQESELLPVIEESMELNRPYAEAKEIKLILEDEGNIPRVLFDPHRINAVFWNLINNSIKYSGKNTKVRIKVYQNGNWVKVSVIDQGAGISEEDKKKLFEFFSTTSSMPTGGESSLGLGLAISKKIVDLHKGKIQVESVPGKGSTFTVQLPVQ